MNSDLENLNAPENFDEFFYYRLRVGSLFGSENPMRYINGEALVSAMVERFDIRVLVTLTADFTDFQVPGLLQFHKPLSNFTEPTHEEVQDILNIVLAHTARGESVLCHCRRGIDRTGCVLGAALTSMGFPPDAVVAEITSHFPARRRSPAFLALWEPYAEVIRSFSADASRKAADGPRRFSLKTLLRRGRSLCALRFWRQRPPR